VLRREGIAAALAKAGLELDDGHVVLADGASEYARTLRRAARSGLPEAWVAFSDGTAEHLTRALAKIKRPARDAAVVSFGARGTRPHGCARTRVVGDTRELGLEAAKLLVKRIAAPGGKPRRLTLRMETVDP
jgi:DNA-binding LacI/PurR family transcriptional regulator